MDKFCSPSRQTTKRKRQKKKKEERRRWAGWAGQPCAPLPPGPLAWAGWLGRRAREPRSPMPGRSPALATAPGPLLGQPRQEAARQRLAGRVARRLGRSRSRTRQAVCEAARQGSIPRSDRGRCFLRSAAAARDADTFSET
jgi:hypothetical protein